MGKNHEDLLTGMAIIILISVVMMYYWERKKDRKVPTHWSFAPLMGIIAGFTTMVGNLAGAFSNIYFLAIKLPKTNSLALLLGCFLSLIYSKFLFIWSWGTINGESFQISLSLIPAVILGFGLGLIG